MSPKATRLAGHKLEAMYLVRNLGTGLVAYFCMCECNYETPWSSTQQSARLFYAKHKAAVVALGKTQETK